MMTRKLVRAALLAVMVAGVLAFAAFVLYVAYASLQSFPAPGRHNEMWLVTGVFALLVVGMEIGLWMIFRRMGRTPAHTSR